MKKIFFFSILGLSLFAFSGCTRMSLDKKTSIVKLEFPQREGAHAKTLGTPLPAAKKVCFGVKVSGPGITNSPNQCSAGFGLFAGFIPEGKDISLEVLTGSDRTFELVTHLVEPSESCPQWGENFGFTTYDLQSTYFSGKTEGVNLTEAEQTVTILVNFPGEANNLMVAQGFNACETRLKGHLFSNGDVTDFLGNILSESSETNEGFYSTKITTDIYGVGFITAGGLLNIGATTPVEIPPYVYSVTRKPDTGAIYGLVGNGQMVSIAISGPTATISELTAANCPFSVDNCKVPDWVQSISAGYGTELFSLDHGGTIYKVLTGNNLVPTGESVPPQVTQVSYY